MKGFRKFFRLSSKGDIRDICERCSQLHMDTYDATDRVERIIASAASCVCEQCRISPHSPGSIEADEILTRFANFPFQITKTGKIKTGMFSHTANRGCSIQRETKATNNELVASLEQFLSGRDDATWKGILQARTSDVRSIVLSDAKERAVCVYDTADENNPAHAEMCNSYVLTDEDNIELRFELTKAFDNGRIINPIDYRGGKVWNLLSAELQR